MVDSEIHFSCISNKDTTCLWENELIKGKRGLFKSTYMNFFHPEVSLSFGIWIFELFVVAFLKTALFILFYFILFYFILFYFILFYFILFYFILFYFILFYFILFYFIYLLFMILYNSLLWNFRIFCLLVLFPKILL